MKTPGAFAVGTDEVAFEGDHVVIHARHPIIDWSVREFHRHAIYFRGRKYFLLTKRREAKPFAMRYELAPWPDDLREQSIHSFTYGEEFVAERDAGVATDRKRSAAWHLLAPLYPLLGFCWSKFKARVLWPLGFAPISITAASTMFTFCVVMCGGILYGYFGVRLFGHLADLVLLAALSLDCALRYGQVISNREVPDGFFEWAFKYRKRTKGGGAN